MKRLLVVMVFALVGASSCLVPAQEILLGTLDGGATGGGATGGGASGGGTGTGGGAPGGGEGTSGDPGIRLIPTSATVPTYGAVELSAELTGSAPNQLINWSIESGGGSLVASGPSTATYRSNSLSASVRIRAQANFLSTVAAFANFVVSPSASQIEVVPNPFSGLPYILSIGSRQTFGAVQVVPVPVTPYSTYQGVRGVDWTVWPSGSIADGTVTLGSSMKRVYARDRASNVWGSVGISVENNVEPSIAVTPELSTIGPNGVVQLTALVSTGAPVAWTVVSVNGGTISTSGTYTAPATPGVYVVSAEPLGGSGLRFGVCTIIVQ